MDWSSVECRNQLKKNFTKDAEINDDRELNKKFEI